MIDVETAINNTQEFFLKNYSILNNPEISCLRLEELELDDNEEYYEITLGWDEPREHTILEKATAGISTPIPKTRHYKKFIVDSHNGKVIKMKVWEGYDD